MFRTSRIGMRPVSSTREPRPGRVPGLGHGDRSTGLLQAHHGRVLVDRFVVAGVHLEGLMPDAGRTTVVRAKPVPRMAISRPLASVATAGSCTMAPIKNTTKSPSSSAVHRPGWRTMTTRVPSPDRRCPSSRRGRRRPLDAGWTRPGGHFGASARPESCGPRAAPPPGLESTRAFACPAVSWGPATVTAQ